MELNQTGPLFIKCPPGHNSWTMELNQSGPLFINCPPEHNSWTVWAPVCPQDTILGPLLFLLYINDITKDTDSELRVFADDCVCC